MELIECEMRFNMNKKQYLILGIILVTICVFFIFKELTESKPFGNLSSSDITNVTVKLSPPDVEYDLNMEEVKDLVPILRSVVTYKKDNSYSEYAGQMVTFNITKENGETLKIQVYSPFIIINDVGYKADYKTCEALNSFANQLGR